jgi:uncharacterized membrane protein YfcA
VKYNPRMDVFIVGAVLVTSTLSGVFGMAGGMLLLGILLVRLPVAEAMVLHGVAQGIANGARAAISFKHVRPSIVGIFTLGTALVLASFGPVGFVVSAPIAMLSLGIIPLTEPLWKRLHPPSIERFAGAFSCGIVVTSFHLAVGTGGPLLDLFFVRSKLDRHGIVATKAAAQTVGHAAKVAYFTVAIGSTGPSTLNPGAWLSLGAMAVVGTYLGRLILDRMSEQVFRRGVRTLIVAIAITCVARGLFMLLG